MPQPPSEKRRPVSFGPFGRNGYVLASDGVRGWVVDRLLHGNWEWLQRKVTWPNAVAAFALLAGLAWGLSQLAGAHRADLVAERRFSPSRTNHFTVRHESLRLTPTGARFETRESQMPRRHQRAWVSRPDYVLDATLQMAASIAGYLALLVPVLTVALMWQRRQSERMAETFGKGSPEHEASRQASDYDPFAERARLDWVLNPPRSERAIDPKNQRRPAFGREA